MEINMNLKQAIESLNNPIDQIEVKLEEDKLKNQLKKKYNPTMNFLFNDEQRRKSKFLMRLAKKRKTMDI